ncbi:MAG: GyrI-like domain-containing protein [Alphaproteobacteria bacterium]|nr:GyrI-like domain-containing protein [Alphaproteobacteria bacterium]
MSKLPEVQRAARAQLAEVVPSLDAGPVGLGITLWHPPADGHMAMEPGFLVSRDFSPVGEVVPSALPAGRAAHVLLIGPYDLLPGAWGKLFKWCESEKLKLAGTNWEIYGGSAETPETALYALLA